MMNNFNNNRLALRFMVLIVDCEANKKVEKILQSFRLHVLFQLRGEGTATSEMLDYFGLGSTHKSITFAVLHKNAASILLRTLKHELLLKKRGTGLAFTLPVSGLSSPIMKMLSEDLRQEIKDEMESEVEKMANTATHDLIIAAVNQGFSEEVMDVAREVGATGGTVIHARRLGLNDQIRFWGISIQPEKEIVAILAKKAEKSEIMKCISKNFGMHCEARGIVISLPVDAVAGLEEETFAAQSAEDAPSE